MDAPEHLPVAEAAARPRRVRALIRKGTTVEQMVRVLSDRIVTGVMRPGERLDEVSLAARFDVSRTPVREALRHLAAMDLVQRRPNRGAIVAIISGARLASMFETMAELEAICARFCATRMTRQEKRGIEIEHQAAAALVRAGAEEDYELFNADFHTRLYRGAHNEHLFALASQTRSRLAPFRRAQFSLEGRLRKSWREHQRIVAAILDSDGEVAGAAARAHVTTVSEVSAVFATSDAKGL